LLLPFYLAAFFAGAAAFLTALGLAAFFTAGFFAAAGALGFLAAGAFFTLGVAGLATFFGVEAVDALFLAATGLAALALLFGLACRGFLAALFALVALADLGVELDRGLVALCALAFLGLAADVELLDLTAVVELPVATFFAALGPGDFDAARFLLPEPALVLDALFLVFLVRDDDFFTPVDSPSLNEPLAPLPLVCLKDFALTPFFKAIFRC